MPAHNCTEILLVEDDPLDRMLTLRALRKLELNVRFVELSDGQELLDHIEKADLVDTCLIILDLKLPRVNGIQALKILNKSGVTDKVPIVMMSSSGLERDVNEAYANGARAYLSKPIKHTEFVEAVQGLGLFWAKYNLLPTPS